MQRSVLTSQIDKTSPCGREGSQSHELRLRRLRVTSHWPKSVRAGKAMPLMSFDGPIWRLLPSSLAAFPSAPAGAPTGRFHHSGQIAAYASLSPEGAGVAIQRYLSDGIPRVLIPMRLSASRVADARGDKAASIIWQDIHAAGEPSPTWQLSDAARQAGAQAMLYSSRSRPDLSHVVVFETRCLVFVGPITQFGG